MRGWWAQWPDANVGLACGSSGVCVLDVDGEVGSTTLLGLESTHAVLPDTPTAITGGGGHHKFFRATAHLGNAVGALPGLDVRTTGGLVVLPPSTHASGREYAWEADRSLDEVELAPMPDWLVTELRGSARQTKPHPSLNDTREIPEGKRNDTLTSLAGSMRRGGCRRSRSQRRYSQRTPNGASRRCPRKK